MEEQTTLHLIDEWCRIRGEVYQFSRRWPHFTIRVNGKERKVGLIKQPNYLFKCPDGEFDCPAYPLKCERIKR